MDEMSHRFEEECRTCLDRFFKAYPNAALQARANKALRLLRASEKLLKGKPVQFRRIPQERYWSPMPQT